VRYRIDEHFIVTTGDRDGTDTIHHVDASSPEAMD
jgi:hypothetical protein